ncbi:Sugar transferase involved in LPS biosynthesis (colanic, teichoic acid) [Pseudarcicella hirudinis]|uniref:Sugar transferase involved in LPS biosynthesis (Colanic, teichoic acid) n=1 Tax=Pseudarcicella hirudinis TaxID=1079859 RepID=A0A1I5WBX8_9BACT|nr:sugar transferase [Pseudarcicella hirudinis]SFQ17209.1 Sugar transferase involved in LPS biosynthesis (colanic, teichoic acid) [Pseudarcicella hirudinis]
MNGDLQPTHLKIYYVEQELSNTVEFLKKFGHELQIKVLNSPEEAIDLIKNSYPPDAVIISKGTGGFQFLDTIRSESWSKNLPVIITVNEITPGVIKEIINKKGDDVFLRDFSTGDLMARLNYFSQRRHYVAMKQTSSSVLDVKIPLWKRAFDVLATGSALLLLSPLLILVAILIKIDSKGPVVYKSKRVGAGYKIFDLYKFRTMRTDADQLIKNMGSLNMYTKGDNKNKISGLCAECRAKEVDCELPLYLDGKQVCERTYLVEKSEKVAFMKFQNDPRITRIGGFLRNTSIDELPQLFNILIGDISLVGNRPLPLYEAEKLTTDEYIYRFAGPGGLTGLWQVTKRGKGKKDMTEEERIQLDIEYAKKFSFGMDVQIILKTFPALLQSENV